VIIPGGGDSKTEPSFVELGKVRFLAFQGGTGGSTGLFVVPVDADLGPLAPATKIADPTESVVESEVVPLDDQRMLVVYIRTGGGPAKLVSKILACGG
jgi:hypothetical protein